MEHITIKIFKELGEYLGKKLDAVAESVRNTPQKIQVDMSDTSKRIEELRDEISSQISLLSKALADSTAKNFQNIKEATTSLSKSLGSLENELNGTEFNITVPDLSPTIKELKNTISDMTSSLSKTSDLNSKETQKTNKEIIKSLASLEKSFKNIEIPSLKPIIAGLDKLEKTIQEKNTKTLEDLTQQVIDAIKGITFKVPNTFKLDEMQLRKLSSGNIGVQGGQLAARNVSLTNLALTATSTEYSYTFPANTVAWTIKLRDQGTLSYYSFTTGTLPTVGGGGNGSKYATIPQNFLQSQDGVDFSGKVIYLGAESASQVAEITVYTL